MKAQCSVRTDMVERAPKPARYRWKSAAAMKIRDTSRSAHPAPWAAGASRSRTVMSGVGSMEGGPAGPLPGAHWQGPLLHQPRFLVVPDGARMEGDPAERLDRVLLRHLHVGGMDLLELLQATDGDLGDLVDQ